LPLSADRRQRPDYRQQRQAKNSKFYISKS
jgi:hypothetical protein